MSGDDDEFTAEEQAYFSSGGVADLPDVAGTDGAAADGAGTGDAGVAGADDAGAAGADDAATAASGVRHVPHAALHAEREARKAAQAELAALREQAARGDERLRLLNELLTGKGAAGHDQADQTPNAEEDPVGAVQYAVKKLQELESRIATGDARAAEQNESQQIRQSFEADARQFLTSTPDFGDAYMHVINGRHAELEALGVSDLAERNRRIAAEEAHIVKTSLGAKRSPSATFYALAAARGYVRKAAAAAADPNAAKLNAIAAAQKTAGASLSNVGGGATGEGLTREALADMSDEEFEAVHAKIGDAKMRQLMGG